MTSKPRKRLPTTEQAVTVTTYEPGFYEPPLVLPSKPPPAVAYGYPQGEQLEAVLAEYSDEFGMVQVVVLRSHDGLYEGEVLALPNCARTAGLIEGGFVDVTVDSLESGGGAR